MAPFDQHLRNIDNLISIKDEDRQPYTKMFDDVRNWLVDEMCRVSPVFKKLFIGICLFGSYPNGVRIVLPSEFDILLTLKFPFPIPVRRDKNRCGFVHLDIRNAIKKLSNHPSHKDIYDDFYQMFDAKYTFLRRDKLQMWIHDIIEKAIDNLPDSKYSISFEKHAVAQNIYVRDKSDKSKKISIDIVPAISICGSKLIRARKLPAEHYANIYAVPKSDEKDPEDTYNYTYMIVNPISERELLWNKQNLKVAYRLLKSMRDRYEMKRLKSAFLTHIFLWSVDQRLDNFWNKPVDVIFMGILKLLRGSFKCGHIPYYWTTRMNLLKILTADEMDTYLRNLDHVYEIFDSIKREQNLSFEAIARHFDVPADNKKSK